MGKLKTIMTTSGGVALLVGAIIFLNIIASRLFVRMDVTSDRVFSLSDGTRRILDKLDDDVTAKLYFSRSIKDLPVVVKTYASRVEEVLHEYAAQSKGRLTVEVVDPKPDTDEEEWANKYGITGVRLPKGDQMYFGVVFLVGSREITIPYLDPRREELLEYDLSESLIRALRREQTRMGIMSSLSVMGGGMGAMFDEGNEPWVFTEDLKRNFKVEEISTNVAEIPEGIKLLLVLHPKTLSQTALYAIDQFVLRGGRLIVAVDPLSRVDLQLNGRMAAMTGQMPTASSDLKQLFEAWGVEYKASSLIGDLTLATQINAGGQVLGYPFFMSLDRPQFAQSSVITSGLNQMLIAEPGALSLKEGSGYKLEPLLTTSRDSGSIESLQAMMGQPLDMVRDLKVDGKERILAGLLRGKFKSAFSAPPQPETASEGQTKPAERKAPHKAEADSEGVVLLIADVDFLHDSNAADKFRFGNQMMVRARNDNLAFLSNAADFLGGSEDLISIRSRGRIQRPFTRVAALQRDAQMRWQSEEDKLTKELDDLQKKLTDLQAQRTDGNRMMLSAAQEAEIANFREAERKARQRRREVRKSLREDVESLGYRLMAANLLLVPMATSMFGVGVFVRRGRRTRAKEGKHAS